MTSRSSSRRRDYCAKGATQETSRNMFTIELYHVVTKIIYNRQFMSSCAFCQQQLPQNCGAVRLHRDWRPASERCCSVAAGCR